MALPNDIAGGVTPGVVEADAYASLVFLVVLIAIVHDLVSPKQE